jgi:predicted transcriptional regulator of viral defense system
MDASKGLQSKFDRIINYVEKIKVLNNEVLIKRSELDELKIYQKDINELIYNGYLEKVRQGWYQVVEGENVKNEAALIAALYPDGVICMYSALFYYQYSDRTPLDWDIAIDRDTSKSRFKLDYPYVKPYYMERKHLEYGVGEADYEGATLKILDRDRLICECIRNEKKMDKETYNKAIQAYINDSNKCISHLIDYAKRRDILKKVKDRIGVWL